MTSRIYYTGDMANQPGWFSVQAATGGNLTLVEDEGGEGRTFTMPEYHVGDVYQGHCSPRFVTEQAYNAYRRGK